MTKAMPTNMPMMPRVISAIRFISLVWLFLLNSVLSISACPICLTETSKARSAFSPARICRSTSSRKCLSNSSSGTGFLIPATSICRRHSTIAGSRLNIFKFAFFVLAERHHCAGYEQGDAKHRITQAIKLHHAFMSDLRGGWHHQRNAHQEDDNSRADFHGLFHRSHFDFFKFSLEHFGLNDSLKQAKRPDKQNPAEQQ